MGLRFTEKAIFLTQQIDFPKIKYKNIENFNLVHAHEEKFGLPLEETIDENTNGDVIHLTTEMNLKEN